MNEWKRLDLTGKWLMAYENHDEFLKKAVHPKTYQQVKEHTGKVVDATVPGNFELDLQRAGIIEDPFWGENLIQTQKLEGYHIWYSRKFDYRSRPNTVAQIVFEGIDTVAEIYLNGELLGYVDNMLITQNFVPGNLVEGENELTVHIIPACIAARANRVSAGNTALKYNYETLRLRKAPHMFGWDIMPRIVSAGIFRPVYLEYKPVEHFKQAFLMTGSIDLYRKTAELQLFYEFEITGTDLSQYSIAVSGNCSGHTFSAESRLWFTAGKLSIHVDDAQFWWPRGSGHANLYHVTVELKKNGKTIDTNRFNAGIRTVRLNRTSTSDEFFNGKFQFEINGKKIFILGTNFVPIDAFHSRDRERLPKVMELLDDVGCNAIRCWGGGVYEDEYLFDFCDQHGILIWQDFIMACALYPIDEDFCRVMEKEAISAVRRLRNHVSIMLWSGDNECDMFVEFEPFNQDPNRNKITRKVLKEVLEYEDPTRPYIPSSPFVDEEAHKFPSEFLPENHLWGPRDYFKSNFYINSHCNFASEIGYHGCSSVESIKKFISKDKLWPWQNNPEWIIHAASPELDPKGTYIYRIELMAKQIQELFGTIPDNLEDFVIASQISQAEAKKFFIELFRLNKGNRTGLIWWNLIDGWPQFSDAVVDYYFDKKLAYHYIKQSQKPVILSFSEPKDWNCVLKAVNDTGKEQVLTYKVTDYTGNNRVVMEGSAVVGDGVLAIDKIHYSQGAKKIYVIEWSCGEYSGKNHYLSGNPPFDLSEYKQFLKNVYSYTGH